MIPIILLVLVVLLFLGSAPARKVAGVVLLVAAIPFLFGAAAFVMVLIGEVLK